MNALFRLLRTRSLSRGVFGGSGFWRTVALVTWGGRFLRKFFAGGSPSTVFLEDLEPGERLVIAHPEASLRGRKARKARRRSRDA